MTLQMATPDVPWTAKRKTEGMDRLVSVFLGLLKAFVFITGLT